MTPEVWIVTWTAVGVVTGQTLWELGIWVARWIREPLDGCEAQPRRVAQHSNRYRPEKIERGGQVLAAKAQRPRVQSAHPRGSDSLNPTPARTVDLMTPEEQARSSRYSATDFDD